MNSWICVVCVTRSVELCQSRVLPALGILFIWRPSNPVSWWCVSNAAPQDIELFADTVAANISRFQLGEDANVIDAARMAGVHEMILRLPDGYDTQAGDGGAVLF